MTLNAVIVLILRNSTDFQADYMTVVDDRPTSMTLNAVIALILRFLRNSTDFQSDYMTVVEDRPI